MDMFFLRPRIFMLEHLLGVFLSRLCPHDKVIQSFLDATDWIQESPSFELASQSRF